MNDHDKLFHGIDRAAWAYFFLYFNINIDGVSLLPTFVGYLLFLSALNLLEGYERELQLLRPLAMLLATWHGLEWFLSFMGRDLYGSIQFLDLIQTLVHLYFHFQLLTNLASIAAFHQPEDAEQDRKLLRCRMEQTLMITGIRLLSYGTRWFPAYLDLISGAMGVIYVITGVYMIKTLHDLRRNLQQ